MADMLGMKPKVDLPKETPTIAIPDEKDPAAIEARRRKMREAQQRGGRESTNMTGSGSPVTYTNTTLG